MEKKLPYLPFYESRVPHPPLAIRESGVWLDEQAQNYAYAVLLHAARENKRAD
jgi:hypothetical protein